MRISIVIAAVWLLCPGCHITTKTNYQTLKQIPAAQSWKTLYKMNEDRVNNSITKIFKAVFPDSTNHYDT